MKSNLEFPDFISEGEAPETEIPDAFSKFLEDSQLAGTLNGGRAAHRLVNNFRIEAAQRDVPIKAAYRKIAEAAAPKVKAPAASGTLKKNFSSPDARLAYRTFFKEQIEMGKTATAVLDAWLAEFEHKNPSVEKLMREVCAEFA